MATLAAWAAVALTLFGMLCGAAMNVASRLNTIDAKEAAADAKIELIINALHLRPSSSTADPTNAAMHLE